MVLRRLSNTLLSVCWCQENGTSLRTRGFGKILNNSLSLLLLVRSLFSSLLLFPTFLLFLPSLLSFISYPFIKPFLLQVLLSLPIIFPSSTSFLPSFLHRFPFLSRTLPPFICSYLLASTFARFIAHALSSCILNLCSFVCLFQHSPSSFIVMVVMVTMMMMMMMIIIITLTLNYYLSLLLFQYSSSLLPIVSNRTVLRTHSWLNSGRSK